MRVGLSLALAVGLGFAGALVAPNAEACGGCFPPPGEQNSVVTDHRMILSVSKAQTTLYDQIQYVGNPKEFAWVLPISGTVDVGLSADSLFNALNNLSAVTVLEPPRNCPPPPVCESDSRSDFNAPQSAGTSSDAGAVNVLKKEVVGPYETVQLQSTDALALENWLTQNGFNVPADIKPIIGQYVAEKFNFLALRLKPGEGVQSMRPVRVTTKGASSVLPLRMVAAGTGANVGITLYVLGEGRYEPTNFPSFVIHDQDLVWDWNTSSSNYKDLRAQRSATQPGKMWEIESSNPTFRSQIENSVRNGFFNPGQPQQTGGDYLPIEDSNGGITKTADAVRDEDLTTAFAGIEQGREHLTRMRSDLSRAALSADLLVGASQDQTPIALQRNPKAELGQPQCPVFDSNCRQTGTLPRDEATARAADQDGTFACQTSAPKSGLGGFGAIGAFLALALGRTVRNRRRAR